MPSLHMIERMYSGLMSRLLVSHKLAFERMITMSLKIMTVCGPIAPEELGFTSMHEHIFSDCSMFRHRVRRIGVARDRGLVHPDEKLTLENRSFLRHNIALSADNMKLNDEQLMIAEITEFREGGGSAILEVSAPGIRSAAEDVFALRRISIASGVHIIASTGLYAEYTWPQQYRTMTYEEYVRFLRHEINHGIGDTGIFPGHIKAAYEVYTEQLESYLRAAAFVAGETGMSLQVHLGLDLSPEEVRLHVVRPLLEGGCIPERTILCHIQLLLGFLTLEELVGNPGRIPFDIQLHRELLQQGFVLSFTPYGFEADDEPLGMVQYPDWYALSGLVALIKEGYAKQLVIGNDVFTKLATRRGGGEGYRRLIDFVIPALKQCGVTDRQVRQLIIENPARLLAF